MPCKKKLNDSKMNSKDNRTLAPHFLNRQFKVDEPNQVCVGDLTYI